MRDTRIWKQTHFLTSKQIYSTSNKPIFKKNSVRFCGIHELKLSGFIKIIPLLKGLKVFVEMKVVWRTAVFLQISKSLTIVRYQYNMSQLFFFSKLNTSHRICDRGCWSISSVAPSDCHHFQDLKTDLERQHSIPLSFP